MPQDGGDDRGAILPTCGLFRLQLFRLQSLGLSSVLCFFDSTGHLFGFRAALGGDGVGVPPAGDLGKIVRDGFVGRNGAAAVAHGDSIPRRKLERSAAHFAFENGHGKFLYDLK